jgi:hypothetical protein
LDSNHMPLEKPLNFVHTGICVYVQWCGPI